MNRLMVIGLSAWITIVLDARVLEAQPAPIPYHMEPYALDTGLHDGAPLGGEPAFREVVRVPDVPWLRLHVADHALGAESFVVFTSLLDGGRQRHDAESLVDYDDGTAFFNGDAVAVELYVAPGAEGVFLRIEEISVGEWEGGEPIPRSLCDDDDRVSSTDPRSGRIVPSGCTGWIVSNNGYVTAGHCVGPSSSILEFQVPPSLCDGTKQFSDPNDQYPIFLGHEVFASSGIGDDFGVFGTARNSNTELRAVHAQGDFFRPSRDELPPVIRITGYGVDSTPPGCTGGRNADNQTEQTNSGPFIEEFMQSPADISLEYVVDTTGGNSGSPIIVDGTDLSIGVHTHAGCNPPTGGNFGTSFENNDFENALDNFVGANAVHVDAGHPSANENGGVLRPFDTVGEGVAAVPPGGTVAIVEGTYNEPLTVSAAMTLRATGGRVTIGQ